MGFRERHAERLTAWVLVRHCRTADWETALTVEDTRADYGERRFISVGWIDDKLFVVVWTPRGDAVRIISARKATPRERKLYEQEA